MKGELPQSGMGNWLAQNIVFLQCFLPTLAFLSSSISSSVVQYADDTFLFRNVFTDHRDPVLQDDLDSISKWAESNCLHLNAVKCKTMRLTWRQLPDPIYTLGGSALKNVSSLKLLGCLFQSNLSWDSHVQDVISKCNRLLGLIRLVSGNSHSCVSLHLYKTLVLPILDYCSSVWWIHSKKHIDSIEAVQRRASRMILRQNYMEQSYHDRLQTLGLMTLFNRRTFLNTSFIAKLLMCNSTCFMSDFLNLFHVNARHPDKLTFYHLSPRTNAYKNSACVRFPKIISELDVETRNSLILEGLGGFRFRLRRVF